MTPVTTSRCGGTPPDAAVRHEPRGDPATRDTRRLAWQQAFESALRLPGCGDEGADAATAPLTARAAATRPRSMPSSSKASPDGTRAQVDRRRDWTGMPVAPAASGLALENGRAWTPPRAQAGLSSLEADGLASAPAYERPATTAAPPPAIAGAPSCQDLGARSETGAAGETSPKAPPASERDASARRPGAGDEGGAATPREPVRCHAERCADGVRIWLGVDRGTRSDALRVAEALVEPLRTLVALRGDRLLGVVCNGADVWPRRLEPAGGPNVNDPGLESRARQDGPSNEAPQRKETHS